MTEKSIDQQMLDKYNGKIVEVDRPNWIEFYMNQAYAASQRSPDAQTKCGCIITDIQNHQLSCGYNAPAKNLPADLIPNKRLPEEGTDAAKYKYFLHAEINAIINASVPLWSIYGGIKAYVTVKPCTYCFSALLNCNLVELYYPADSGWGKSHDQELDFEFLAYYGNVKIFPQKRS